MKREKIIEEEYEWQVEKKYERGNGLSDWSLIAVSDTCDFSVERIMNLYSKLKKDYKNVRLLRWSKVVKYEVMDGEGF